MSGTDYSLPEGTTDTTSTGVTLTSGEDFEVQDGGTTYDTDIENGATEDVLGTTASAVSSFILSGGEEDVYDGATDTGSVVSSGGILSAFAADGANPPGDVVSTTVLSGGEVQVEGLSDAVSVGQGGLVETADAGLTSDTQVQSGGTELVYDDGSSDGTMVSTGGVQVALASFGTSGQVLTVSGSNGVVETASGGSGSFAISSGSVTDTFTSNANGSLSVVASNSVTGQYESGTATSGLLYSAYIAEFTGGTASNTTVQSGATILLGGGADPGLDVDYGGQIQIGGAFDVGVDAGGALATAILTGATASGVTVADGATLTVTSGNIADDTTIAPGGVEEVQYGAEDEVTGATTAPGTITIQSGARQDVQSGGVTLGVVLSGGVQYVNSGGTTSNTVVSSGGKQGVIAGGNAFGTTVLSGAAFYYEGGNVVGLTVSSGGSAVIEGPAPGVTVTEGGLTVDVGGTLYVLHDGIAVGTDLANGAMGIQSGGIAIGTIAASGTDISVFSGGLNSGATVNGTSLDVYSGGTDIGTLLGGSSQEVIASGGLAISTTVVSGAILGVLSGGTVTATSAASGGTFVVSNGGMAVNAVISSFGSGLVQGSATGTMLQGLGTLTVLNGGTAANTTISGQASTTATGTAPATGTATETVNAGGTANATSVTSGQTNDYGTDEYTTLLANGEETVEVGGVSFNTVVSSGGLLDVYGTAVSASIILGGSDRVEPGGTASSTTIAPHTLLLVYGNTYNDVISGYEETDSGGTTISATVNTSGFLLVSGGERTGGDGAVRWHHRRRRRRVHQLHHPELGLGRAGGTLRPRDKPRGLHDEGHDPGGGKVRRHPARRHRNGGVDRNRHERQRPERDARRVRHSLQHDRRRPVGLLLLESSGIASVISVGAGATLFGLPGSTASGTTIDTGGMVKGSTHFIGLLQNDGTIEASSGTTVIAAGETGSGTLIVDSGATLDIGGDTTVADLDVSAGGTVDIEGVTVTTDPVTVSSGGTLSGDGTLTGTLTDDGDIVAAGGSLTLTGAITGPGVLTVDAGGTLTLDGAVAAGTTVDFAGSTGTLDLADPMAFMGAIVGQTAGDMVNDVACYAAGTHITTPAGEIAVQDLTIDDLVRTASSEGRPVLWIGRRSYAGRFLAANPGVQPIRFQSGSLGDGLPRRDLLVSPEHAMFLDGLLVPARCLVNGSTITQERGLERVDYFHVELDSHDVLLAEGAPSESFLDDDSRGMFHNAHEFAVLYPTAPEPGRFCAPKVDDGYELEAIRRRLARVAAEMARAA
jgi:autotransporter passenger strand-loop-strand repeat protein